MGFEDLDSVMALERICFESPWAVEVFIRELGRPHAARYLVAERAGEVVGYIGAQLHPGELHVANLAVSPFLRRQGLATLMLFTCIVEGVRRGVRWVTLEVRESNRPARNFYETFGFVEMGKRRGYYFDKGEDAVIMSTGDIREREYVELLAGIRESLGRKGARLP